LACTHTVSKLTTTSGKRRKPSSTSTKMMRVVGRHERAASGRGDARFFCQSLAPLLAAWRGGINIARVVVVVVVRSLDAKTTTLLWVQCCPPFVEGTDNARLSEEAWSTWCTLVLTGAPIVKSMTSKNTNPSSSSPLPPSKTTFPKQKMETPVRLSNHHLHLYLSKPLPGNPRQHEANPRRARGQATQSAEEVASKD
jgi:hypothetical protein